MLKHLPRRFLVLAVVAAAPACYYDASTGADRPVDDYPLPTDGASELPDWPDPTARRELLINSEASSLRLTVADLVGHTETPSSLPVLGGVLGFSPEQGGALTLDEIQVVLGDVHIPTQSSGDVVLTGIRLESEPGLALPVSWREPGHQGFLKAPVTLRLVWQVIGNSGRAWPLAEQSLQGATLYLHVGVDSNGRYRADLLGIDTGTFWHWDGIYALKDAVLTLVAREPAVG